MSLQKNICVLDLNNKSTLNKVYVVFQRSYRVEAGLIGVRDFPPLHRGRDEMRQASTVFVGYWVASELAAIIEIQPVERQLEICSLVVDPAFFRQGIASRLLSFVLNERKWKTAVVETAVVNKPAITLYQKHGFVECKRWRPDHGIEKIMLCLVGSSTDVVAVIDKENKI